MSMTDPIADLLTRIRNALLAKHDRLDVPSSTLKVEVCRIFREQGFIDKVEIVEQEPGHLLRIYPHYSSQGEPAIRHVKRVSRPGRRVYRGADEIKPVRNGLGVAVVSTSRGLLTDSAAREARVGGEILCEIW